MTLGGYNDPILPTGTSTRTIRKSPSLTETRSTILNEAGPLRTYVNSLTAEIVKVHHASQDVDLQQRAAVKVRSGVRTLLDELATDRGMSWADIARLTSVTVSAIRKWRNGGQASAENRLELAKLAAFLDLLEENCIEDPVQWMEVTFPLGEGYAIRPMELYVAGHKAELLDIACSRRNAADVLDSLDSSWRDARRSNVDVYIGPDGEPALRIRDSQ